MAKLNAALAAKGNEKMVKNHGGIHKKKNPKYKQTPTGKVALINGSKAQNNNNKKQQVQNKNNSPQKVQKNNVGKENSPAKKHNSPVGKNNSPVGKNNSPAGKMNSPAQKKKNSPAGKNDKKKQQQIPQKQSPKNKLKTSPGKLDLEEDEESDEDYNEGIILQEEYSFAGEDEDDDEDLDDEEESDDEDIPNIFGTSLADHTEDDDEEFDAEEESVAEKKGVKMFRGLPKDNNESLDTSNVENEEEEEVLGLKTLLGNSIVDDEDDEDFEIDEEVVEDEAEYQSDFTCSDEDEDEDENEDEDDEDTDEEEEDEDEDKDHSTLDSSKKKTDNKKGTNPMTDEERAEKRNRTIFVGNLPVQMTKESLHKVFKKFGPIENLRFRGAVSAKMNVPKKRAVLTKKLNPNVKTAFAYILYKSEKSAKDALSMNGKKVEDHYLRVDSINLKTPDAKKCVFVGNLNFRTNANTLWDHFKDCGKIESVRIVKDRLTGLGKGIAYINFHNKDSVHLALNLNGSQVGNREIRVCTYAQDQIEKSQKAKLKRSLPGKFKNETPSKKIKTNPDDAVARATHNSESAMRRKAQKTKNAQQTSNNQKEKGTFQGQKATDGKKKKKQNKLDIKKKVMAAKLAAKPKKPVS